MNTDSNLERIEIYQAIGELAYVVAKSDHDLTFAEKEAFYKIAKEELDYDSWAARDRFDLLDRVTQPTIYLAYFDALEELKKHGAAFTTELKEKALLVLQRFAACCEGLNANEAFVLARFRNDLQSLG